MECCVCLSLSTIPQQPRYAIPSCGQTCYSIFHFRNQSIILHVCRNYDIRVSLSNFETVDDPSVTQFITSTIEMPEPGVLHYNPSLSQEKWSVNYIRYQESETFKLQDSYVVEISAVGEYMIRRRGNTEHTISQEKFRRRHELEVRIKLSETASKIYIHVHTIHIYHYSVVYPKSIVIPPL